MDIVIGWGVVALYLVVLYLCMGSDYVWLIGMLIGWAEARELFGEQWVGAFGLTVALTVALVGWGTKLTRWIRHRRSPLLIR